MLQDKQPGGHSRYAVKKLGSAMETIHVPNQPRVCDIPKAGKNLPSRSKFSWKLTDTESEASRAD